MRILSDGRVRRSRTEWQAILRRFEKSGLSGTAFCAREEISPSAFSEWKRKLGERTPARASRPRFVELTGTPAVSLTPSQSRGAFEISLPGGVVLRWTA